MSKSDNIELSPQHGLNATIPICFFCGEDKGEIALMGRIRKRDSHGNVIKGSDEKAPMRMLMDYHPCDKCQAIMDQGVTLMGVKPADGKHAEIQKGIYPTGAFTVMKPESFKRVFKDAIDEDTLNAALEKKRIYLDHDTLVSFMESVNKNE